MSKEKPNNSYEVVLTVALQVNGDNAAEAVKNAIEVIKEVTTRVQSVNVVIETPWRQ